MATKKEKKARAKEVKHGAALMKLKRKYEEGTVFGNWISGRSQKMGAYLSTKANS